MIRAMLETDIDAVLEIEQELFHSPWTKEQFLYELKDNAFAFLYVLEQNHQIIGYLDYWITFETAQLAKIAISKRAQRQGHAQALMKYLIDQSEHAMCENISLEVRVTNEAALALYRSFDFIEVTIRKGYYQDGCDASMMVKALGGNYV